MSDGALGLVPAEPAGQPAEPLGLVKHAAFVERVWFDEAVTCRSRAEIGIPATPDESFILHDSDTIATVQQAHREVLRNRPKDLQVLPLLYRHLTARASEREADHE